MQNSEGSEAASDFIPESTSARRPQSPGLSQWQPRLKPRTLIVLRAWLNQEGLQGLQEGPQGILRQPLAAFTQPIILRAWPRAKSLRNRRLATPSSRPTPPTSLESGTVAAEDRATAPQRDLGWGARQRIETGSSGTLPTVIIVSSPRSVSSLLHAAWALKLPLQRLQKLAKSPRHLRRPGNGLHQ